MNRRERDLMVINDGAKIRPDWTDRIAVSYIPNTSKEYFAWYPTIDTSSEQTDLSGLTINIKPVTFCCRAWEVRDMTGAAVTDEIFTDFDAPCPAMYSLESWGNLMIDLTEMNIYKGGLTTKSIAWRYDGTTSGSRRDSGVNPTINPDFAGWTALGSATIDYSHNVVYTQTYRGGDTSQVVLGNNEGLVLYDETIMHNIPQSHTRFYIKELGCYTLGSKSSLVEIDSDIDGEDGDGEPEYETVYDSINYQDLTSDYFIRKSEVCGVQKVIANGEYFVELNIGKRVLSIRMGEVWNKNEWTNDIVGLDACYNEISEWII